MSCLVSICYIILVLFLWLLLLTSTFCVLVFHSDCILRFGFSLWLHLTTRECGPNAIWSEIFWLGEKKLHHLKARAYSKVICFFYLDRDRSFVAVLILDRVWPIIGQDKSWRAFVTQLGQEFVILFTGTQLLLNPIFWLLFLTFKLIVPVATNSLVSSEGQNWTNGRVLWSQDL